MRINVIGNSKTTKEKVEFTILKNGRGITKDGEYLYGDIYIHSDIGGVKNYYIMGTRSKLFSVEIVQKITPLVYDGQPVYEGDYVLARYKGYEHMFEVGLDSYEYPTLFEPGTVEHTHGLDGVISMHATEHAVTGLFNDKVIEFDDLDIILVVTPKPIKING